MMAKKNLRRQFFIKREFQSKFILLYAGAIVFLAGLVTVLLYRNVRTELERHLYSSHLKIGSTGEILSGHLLTVNILALCAIVSVVMAVSLVIFSRLNRHFSRLGSAIDAFGRGDFAPRPLPPSHIQEITLLMNLTERTREDYRSRFEALTVALDELERACQCPVEPQRLQACAEKLRAVLRQVDCPEQDRLGG